MRESQDICVRVLVIQIDRDRDILGFWTTSSLGRGVYQIYLNVAALCFCFCFLSTVITLHSLISSLPLTLFIIRCLHNYIYLNKLHDPFRKIYKFI